MKDLDIFYRLFAHSGFDSKIIRYFPYDGGKWYLVWKRAMERTVNLSINFLII